MTETVAGRLHLDFGPFIERLNSAAESVRLFGQILRQHCPFMTRDEVRTWLEACEGVRRVNFWPEHTVTVWMTWTPRPTWDQIRKVRDTMDMIVPVGIRRRIMALPSKYGPPVWHKYIPLTERVQRDIDRMVICGQ